MNWATVMLPQLTWTEKMIRPLLVFTTLLIIFRFGAKRALAQATLFDFLVLLLISNVVQNAMIGDDNSVLGAAAGALMLVVFSGLLNRAAAQSNRVRRVLEGRPAILVFHGHIDQEMMRRQGVAPADLLLAIRKNGFARVEDVAFAVLELDGTISIIGAQKHCMEPTSLPDDIDPHSKLSAASEKASAAAKLRAASTGKK